MPLPWGILYTFIVPFSGAKRQLYLIISTFAARIKSFLKLPGLFQGAAKSFTLHVLLNHPRKRREIVLGDLFFMWCLLTLLLEHIYHIDYPAFPEKYKAILLHDPLKLF